VLFTFAPTAVELVFVTSLLAAKFSPLVAGLVGATFLTYVTWTLACTQLAVEVRKQVGVHRQWRPSIPSGLEACCALLIQVNQVYA
jgi:ABC-type transport system involved in Fe-S cluster assembly fused permease/ATPase subunit